MTPEERRKTIDEVIYQKYGSCESLVYIAENHASDDLREADQQLYAAMRRLDEAAGDVEDRMLSLIEELDLDYDVFAS